MTLKNLSVDGEPYQYLLAERHYALHSFNSQPTIVAKGDYLVLDRHFNTFVVEARAWEQVMKKAFKQFKRKQGGVTGDKDSQDKK